MTTVIYTLCFSMKSDDLSLRHKTQLCIPLSKLCWAAVSEAKAPLCVLEGCSLAKTFLFPKGPITSLAQCLSKTDSHYRSFSATGSKQQELLTPQKCT